MNVVQKFAKIWLGVCIALTAASAAATGTGEKPLWRFSVLVSIDNCFVEQFDGFENCESLVRQQLDSINHIFNDPGVFDGEFDFYLDSLQCFYAQSGVAQAHEPHPNQDYQLVYDFDSRTLLNWLYPPDNTVLYRTFSTAEVPFPFITIGNLALAHELAHSRGAVDQYGLDVDSAWNFVNGESFSITGSYMSDLMSQVWSEHTIAVINKNADTVLSPEQYRLNIFPQDMIVRVQDSLDFPLAGAIVNVYGHTWYNMTLNDKVLRSGSTDLRGEFMIDPNDFIGPEPGEPCPNPLCMKYPTLLVKVVYGTDTVYAWLPFLDPQVHALRKLPGAYVKTVAMDIDGGSRAPLPEWFRLSQNYPNPFNGPTTICVSLLVPGQLRLEVADILGRTVAVLNDNRLPAGESCFEWDGRVSSGVYFARAQYEGHDRAIKMLLIK